MGRPHTGRPAKRTGRINRELYPSERNSARHAVSRGDHSLTMSERMNATLILQAEIYFSYNQFFVFDRSVKLPGCYWTEAHYKQGFARRDRNVCFGTLLEFGHAALRVHEGPYQPSAYPERVIEVPFQVSSEEVVVAGPEEFDDVRMVKVAKGDYRLTVAQAATGDESETIELYFELLRQPLPHSRIVLADEALEPPVELLETAEVA